MNVYQILQTPDMTDRDDIRDAALTPNPVFATLDAAKQHALALVNENRAEQDRDCAREIRNGDLSALGQLDSLSWEQHDGETHDLPCWIAIDAETDYAFEIVEMPLL